jgi:hypothetical protein
MQEVESFEFFNNFIKNQITRFRSYDKDKLMEEILFFKFRSDCKKSKNKKRKCELCDKILSSTANYKKHIKSGVCTKVDDPNKHKCEYCNVIFASKQNLQYHIANEVCKNKINNPIEDELVKHNLEQDNTTNEKINKNTDGYVYLLQLTDTHTNEHFYKIGKTNRTDPFSRISEYTPGYKMLFTKYSNNPTVTENKFLDILRKDKQIKKYEYGKEYFISLTPDYIFNLLISIN